MAYTFSDFLRTRVHALRQPAPILQFYEVEIPDGTYQRYVDFADRDLVGGNLPTRIPFNGQVFSSVSIVRGEIQEGTDGADFQMPVSVYDPTHAGAFFLRTFDGLREQLVRFWLIPSDHLDHPEDAYQETFQVIHSSINQGPDSITLTLGHPNLAETRLPKLFYDRRKCINPYHDRFLSGSLCSYPSNEFGQKTQENLISGAIYGEQLRSHGWRTSQARRASTFDVNLDLTGYLTIASSETRIAWNGRERYGPALYREISGAFDVETRVIDVASSRGSWAAGLIVQNSIAACPFVSGIEEIPTDPVTSWAFWGISSGSRLLGRAAVQNDAAAIADWSAETAPYIRIVRAGDALSFYSRSAPADSWILRGSATLLGLGDPVLVGVAIASDERSALEVKARFDYIRFTAGGLSTCKRSWEDCLLHGNTVEFNGFREMPNDRARY